MDGHKKYTDELASGYKKIVEHRIAISNADKAKINEFLAPLSEFFAAPKAAVEKAAKAMVPR